MLSFLSDDIKKIISSDFLDLCEVRMRVGSEIVAYYGNGTSRSFDRIVSAEDIDKIILKLTKHSVYLFSDSLKQGFLHGDCGERVGLCGTCVMENGCVKMIKDVSSVCIRIPHEIVGFSDKLIDDFVRNGISSTLVISPPGFGKTTFLRDVARGISVKLKRNVLVSDEKKEIYSENFSFGKYCDFLLRSDKSFAFTFGVRNMHADVILCDELSDKAECVAAVNACLSGVSVIASAHASSIDELKKKPFFEELFSSKVFEKAVVIGRRFAVDVVDL